MSTEIHNPGICSSCKWRDKRYRENPHWARCRLYKNLILDIVSKLSDGKAQAKIGIYMQNTTSCKEYQKEE